ncbi:MAG: hypothetical protein PVJ72_06880 [Gammaproteobacteria bacterium]|jgi:hypothetical protein
MKRLIIKVLIFTVLFVNIAWAADSHEQAFFGHAEETMHDTQIHPEHDSEHAQSDHCCHGAVHLTGLANSTTHLFHDLGSSGILPNIRSHKSNFPSPPTPIPILYS